MFVKLTRAEGSSEVGAPVAAIFRAGPAMRRDARRARAVALISVDINITISEM